MCNNIIKMTVQQQILELLIKLKKTKDANEKKKIKDKLKKLYNTFNRVSRKKLKLLVHTKRKSKILLTLLNKIY